MVKYHFVPRLGKPESVTHIFSKSGGYEFILSGTRGLEMAVKEFAGSLYLFKNHLDGNPDNSLDKLHVDSSGTGENFLFPHAEVKRFSGKVGPRLDLGLIDGKYAEQYVQKLNEWLDQGEEKRTKNLLNMHKRGRKKPPDSFNVKYRTEQLRISDNGLREKIESFKFLSGYDVWLSDSIENMRQQKNRIIEIAQEKEREFMENGHISGKKPKIITDDCVYDLFRELSRNLTCTLNRIGWEMDNEMLESMETYWDDVAAWGKL